MKKTEGGNSIRTKHANQIAIREMIFRHGPIARADISRRLDLTLPTITTTVNSMIAAGIVQECTAAHPEEKSMGRPATPVDIVPDAAFVIGVEMRGTCRYLCITDLRGKIVYADSDEEMREGYEEALASACMLIRKALASNTVPAERIFRMCICTPGVHSQDGQLIMHPGYNWKNKPLKQDVIDRTGFRGQILTINNARARAFGVMLFHQEVTKEASSFAYLMISSGIGCPFILNNGITASTALGLGEVGHMVVDLDGPLCRCGNRGCLEALSSDQAVVEAMKEEIRRGKPSLLADKAERIRIRDVLDAQSRGDHIAAKVVRRAVMFLGLAVANLYNFIRPDVLLIEGALFCSDRNRDYFLEVVHANLYSTVQDANFVFRDPLPVNGALGAAGAAVRDYLSDYSNLDGNRERKRIGEHDENTNSGRPG